MTLIKQLEKYIKDLCKLKSDETWECESIDAVASEVLPSKYVADSPIEDVILNTFTYYNDELHEVSIYPFMCYLNGNLIAMGYIDNLDLDFLYFNDTKQTIIDERHLLKGGNKYE